jgi:cell division protein FtsI/penicillin-binding protein 2
MLRVHKRTLKGGDVANLSIGQGDILISPLQMAQAMSVMANGGFLHQARLVLQVQSIDNKVVAAYPDRIREQIPVSPEVREELRRALVGVTSDALGTAHQAAVKGIEVAGKTGTAQKLDADTGTYSDKAWVVSFVCGAPAENPRVLVLVMVDEPTAPGIHYGGTVAAPTAAKIVQFAEARAAELGLPYPTAKDRVTTAQQPEESAKR